MIYDLRQKSGVERVIAQRFARTAASRSRHRRGRSCALDVAHRAAPAQRAGAPPRVRQTLEDTPFYVRSLIDAQLLGETVTSVHETLDLPRLVALDAADAAVAHAAVK